MDEELGASFLTGTQPPEQLELPAIEGEEAASSTAPACDLLSPGLKSLMRSRQKSRMGATPGSTTLQAVVGQPKPRSRHDSVKLTAYLNKADKAASRSASVDATMGRHAPVPWDGTRLPLEQRMQDLMAECGLRRSLPTNLKDLGNHCNTNMLRFHRSQTNLENLALDGGWQYGGNTCVGNWVEDRWDPAYASGFRARELQGHTYSNSTESLERYRPWSEKYLEKVKTERPIAKFPKAAQRRAFDSDGRHLYYSTGFGESTTEPLDHTCESKRGGYWVGTAPLKKHESIATTTSKQEQLEFQKRCANYDPKARILESVRPLDMTDRDTRRAMASLRESQRHTANWSSAYGLEFKDHSRQPCSTALPDIQPRPISD